MRCLIASGLLCLLVVPVKALEAKPPEVKITRSASASDDPTRDALMDSVGPSSTEGDAAAVLALDGVAPVVAVEVDAKLVVYRPMAEVCEAVTQAAKSNNLPVGFFIRLLHQESGFKPDVVSRAGAQGVAQFMPEVAASMGVENPFDPLQAIPASARLLRDLFQKFGNLGLALRKVAEVDAAHPDLADGEEGDIARGNPRLCPYHYREACGKLAVRREAGAG